MRLIAFLSFLYAVSAFSLAAGIFLLRRPDQAIRIQMAFYEKINWRLEPISMAREVRHTRIMGGCLVVIGLVTLLLIAKSRI